jgi:hypothetical protein
MDLVVQYVKQVGGGTCQVIQFPQQQKTPINNPISWWLNQWAKAFEFYGL